MMCFAEVQKYRADLTRTLESLERQIADTKSKLIAVSVILEGER